MTRETIRFFSYVCLDDVTVSEAAELGAIAVFFFADTWDDNLDPEVSAQLVQESAQAYLSFSSSSTQKTRNVQLAWEGYDVFRSR